METTWQDIVVWAIGLAAALLVVRRIACLVRGKSRCSSCAASGCPLHGAGKRKKKSPPKTGI